MGDGDFGSLEDFRSLRLCCLAAWDAPEAARLFYIRPTAFPPLPILGEGWGEGSRSGTGCAVFQASAAKPMPRRISGILENRETPPHENPDSCSSCCRVASWRVTTVLAALFQQAPTEPSMPVSVALGSPVSSCIKPLSGRLPCVDISVTIFADHKGFSTSGCHYLLPDWFFPLPFDL
jgi:hypothetical protein